jgi:uncharacterized protein
MMLAETSGPPAGAVSLFVGKVMHARLKPVMHRFTYSVFTVLVDLDRIAEAGRLSPLFSIARWNLLSFNPFDHGAGAGSLRAHINGLLERAGLEGPARVVLWCYPRVLGFVFNPISVYFAYDHAGQCSAVIYEVRNTFGEMHTYVAPVAPGELSEAGIRQQRDKLFYVSPFLDMPMRYHFRLKPPGDQISVRILETDCAGPILAATFHGDHKPLTSRAIAKQLMRVPFLTLKVVAGIHWEALKLWIKGARFHSRPKPPEPASYDQPGPYRTTPNVTGSS